MTYSARIFCFILWIGASNINSATEPHFPLSWDDTAQFLHQNCADCHTGSKPEAGFSIPTDQELSSESKPTLESLERIVKRVASGQMPPPDAAELEPEDRSQFLDHVTDRLDSIYAQNPRPGRVDTVRRLNRTEYQFAIRDLLGLEFDVSDLLPADQAGHGFDNVTVGELSPVLLSRYISAAEKIARLAVGGRQPTPIGFNLRLPPDLTQDRHIEGLPLGTRGGTQFTYTFPASGEYEIQLRLMRDRDENVEGLNKACDVDFLLDGRRVERLKIEAPKRTGANWSRDDTLVDAHLRKRFDAEAGPHQVTVTFPTTNLSLLENRRQPFQPSFNRHRHPRREPAIYEVSIVGPFQKEVDQDSALDLDTPSRKQIFVSYPKSADPAEAHKCAREIFEHLLPLAYRRPITNEDLQVPLAFFDKRYRTDGFEPAIETALTAVLVNPHFLFRAERSSTGSEKATAVPVSDMELASRLSFFLWSSIPDQTLLNAAESGKLRNQEPRRELVAAMLFDPKAKSLVTNFAAQWLYLRNLDSFQPDLREFPNFDDNLRQAMRRETEMHFERMLLEDRSILDLIRSDTTFLNDRLAEHYGIRRVHGSHFREVKIGDDEPRGGLLRQASILAVTSYATRTSPTIRGNWILENILGTPPPPPPPNVPSLKEKTNAGVTSVRERLRQHRENPACASCHDLMDPVGFALENFDAVGRWRDFEDEISIDSTGSLPDGTRANNVAELEQEYWLAPKCSLGL